MTAIAYNRLIGPVLLNVIVSEKHSSELEISENPVEAGAKITDHAFTQPKKLVLDVADTNAAATFQALVRFQDSRVPFKIITGLSVYNDMLIRRLDADRDVKNSSVLRCSCELQEIIIVDTAHASTSTTQEGERGGKSEAGGKNSRRSASPSKSRASDAATKDRASAIVQRGDSATNAVPADRGSSLAYQMFGPK